MMNPTGDLLDVTVIVPCRNEKNYIAVFLQSLFLQDLDGITWEALIADGMSNDGTRAIIESQCREWPIRIVDNPQRIVSTGLNRAIAEARGRYIVRMDAHTTYAPDYIRQCLRTAEDTAAENVGGPWVPRGQGYIGSAISAAFQSSFGSGAAKAHDPSYEGLVDTVYLGCWPRVVFVRLGLFDPQLVRNQDDEFNLRIRRAGGIVWQSPKIVSFYHPRSSMRSLFRQYLQYGFWKVAVIRKHRLPASFRHVVPGGFVAASAALPLLTLLSLLLGLSHVAVAAVSVWVVLLFVYLTLCGAASVLAARKHGWILLPVLPIVFAIYHVGYGCGFLLGVVYSCGICHCDTSKSAFSELTR